MKHYFFKIFKDGNAVSESSGPGNNALEALEECVSHGMYIPSGKEVDVLCLCENDLGIRFKVIKGF